MKPSEILEELGRLEPLRRVERERGMIYDLFEKERCAALLGMPLDSFYDLAFPKWTDVSRFVFRVYK